MMMPGIPLTFWGAWFQDVEVLCFGGLLGPHVTLLPGAGDEHIRGPDVALLEPNCARLIWNPYDTLTSKLEPVLQAPPKQGAKGTEQRVQAPIRGPYSESRDTKHAEAC